MRRTALLGVCLGCLALPATAQPAPVPTPALPGPAQSAKPLAPAAEKAPPVPAKPEAPPLVKIPRKLLVGVGQALKVPGAPAHLGLPAAGQSALCKWEKKGNVWWLRGLSKGEYEFLWGKETWTVTVRERALALDGPLVGKLVGDYPLADASRRWLRDLAHPQARWQIQGQKVTAQGSDLIPFDQTVQVQATKLELPPLTSQSTLLSNWPERLLEDQILLEEPVAGQSQVRIMVHHRNMPEQPLRYLEIELEQKPGPAAEYALSPYLVGPSQDEIFAGHLAAQRYFENTGGPGFKAYVVRLQAGQKHLIERLPIKPGQTVSGMIWLRGLGAAESGATVRVRAVQADSSEPLQLKPMEEGARTARGTFPGEVVKPLDFTCGASYLFEDIGGTPYVLDAKGVPSPGNFGVVYRYKGKLTNPTQTPQEVRMELSARGGPARACMWLDGQALITGNLKAEPILIKRWLLAAGETRDFVLETFPQAGSNFPLSLTLSSRANINAQADAVEPSPGGWFIP